MLFEPDDGLIVLGHGSRAPEAGVLLNWVADRLTHRLGTKVLPASLQFNEPTLEDCCRRMAASGVRRIVVAPYFLFTGNHLQKDIPDLLARLRRELAGVEIVLADPLGADELLVEVVARRALTQVDGDIGSTVRARSRSPLSQHPIEAESFEIIDSLLEPEDTSEPEYQVVRRIVHTSGDPSLARAVQFSDGAVAAGVEAITANSNIYCDVNMVAAGIEPTAAGCGLPLTCLVADPEAGRLAEIEGITRGAAAVRLAAGRGLDGAVVAIGNSPTALFELLRLAEGEDVRPALVVGVPVGFVGAAESKEVLAASGLPFITIPGNRGGSTIAAAAVNALIRMSTSG